MASVTLPTIRVDVWTLRCHFNRFHYYERGQTGEIDVIETRKPRQPTVDRPYVASVESYYRDKDTGIELARTHHYLRADGTIGASGQIDPKSLYVAGVRYRLHKGPEVHRDPSTRFHQGSLMYRAYASWRRLKCALFRR
jgi:hypothetical protein